MECADSNVRASGFFKLFKPVWWQARATLKLHSIDGDQYTVDCVVWLAWGNTSREK